MEQEIRRINGIDYKVVKVPCNCHCHKEKWVRHIMACCDNGYVEKLIKLEK